MEYFNGGLGPGAWKIFGISAALLLAALLVGILAYKILFWVLARFTVKWRFGWNKRALEYARGPARLLFPLLFLNIVVSTLKLPAGGLAFLAHVLNLLFIAGMAYLCVCCIYLARDYMLSRHDMLASDNLLARKMYTRINIFEKALLAIVVFVTTAFMLMTFQGVRHIGVSLLASAGIVGIVIGLAAQKSVGDLLAGLQMAMTQPIRIDDALIVEGEYGNVEEITLTFVVVRLWDLRRMILPITYFLEKPFQNWTRVSADLLGTVFLYLDYTTPVEALREEAKRAVESAELWDKKVFALQVTDCRTDVMEIRVLMSASSSGRIFDLRCLVREKLVEFIQKNHPESLPKYRAEFQGGFPSEGKNSQASLTASAPTG